MLRPKKPLHLIVLEDALLLLYAYAFALLIKGFFFENYQIPTSSMEPTLLGTASYTSSAFHNVKSCPYDEYHEREKFMGNLAGDQIIVSRFFYGLTDVKRFDCIVFKFPLNISKNFIKRAVALPEEWFFIYAGDVYFNRSTSPTPPPSTEFKIARKPLATQESIWINVHSWDYIKSDDDLLRYWDVDGKWVLKEGRLELADSSMFYKDLLVESGVTTEPSNDLYISFNLDALRKWESLEVIIENSIAKLRIALTPDEQGAAQAELVVDGESFGRRRLPEFAARNRVEMFFYDGELYFRFNGETVFHQPLIVFYHANKYKYAESRVGIRVTGGPAAIDGVTLMKDIHYRTRGLVRNFAEGQPVYVPKGSYIVLGDNVYTSHDGRAWRLYRVGLPGVGTIEVESQSKYQKADGTWIVIDRYGNEYPCKDRFWENDNGEPYHLLDEKYIIGKAFFTWWPPTRWFRKIR